MSGFVVGYGSSNRGNIERMLEAIKHRGTYASGIYENNDIIIAQNYLEADCPLSHGQLAVPVTGPGSTQSKICYDGQIGNWEKIAGERGISDGPFREEHLLLHLYNQHGKEMLSYLKDAIFTFVIFDGRDLFAARDLLGIKTLYYGRKDETLYLASELKGVLAVTDDVHEFPPGHYMDGQGRLVRFEELPKTQPELLDEDIDVITDQIRELIRGSLNNRVDFNLPTAGLLSGGIDSSVITSIASGAYRERFGKEARLKTFALGVGESEDIQKARVVARHINSDHSELIVNLEQVLKVLSDVIYYLESFDPSLVRSSVSNYLISRYAREQGIQVLLSGEGGDEVFCGYTYLKDFSIEELFSRQIECMGFLHNNASLRLDHMNQCHGVRVVAPLISGQLLHYALRIPPEYKQKPEGNQRIEKWIFRKSFESLLPEEVVWRTKQEFSQGSGSADILPAYFENVISDDELAEAQAERPIIRSKEELFYFRLFVEHFGENEAVDTVGQWVSL